MYLLKGVDYTLKQIDRDNEIIQMIKYAKSYFGSDETIYIYECNKCHKLDPVPGFIVNEQLGFLKFIKQKKSYEMQCPYCGKKSFPIRKI